MLQTLHSPHVTSRDATIGFYAQKQIDITSREFNLNIAPRGLSTSTLDVSRPAAASQGLVEETIISGHDALVTMKNGVRD
jgi:hypothetical protein